MNETSAVFGRIPHNAGKLVHTLQIITDYLDGKFS